MNKRILAAFLAVIMVFSCLPVMSAAAADTAQSVGTTYYVSNTGSADNNGTSPETPFNSLLRINEIELQPGDKVLLERGSVFENEYLHIKGSGSAEHPIIIDAYGDENLPMPLIQTNACEGSIWYQDYGRSLDNSWHKYKGNVSSCILLYDVEYIEISNIAMTNEGNFQNGEVYNTYGRMDRTGVAGIAENIGTVDHIYLRNLDIRNVQGSVHDKHMANGGIYLLCLKPDNDAATGVSRFDDVLIEGCRLDEVNRWGIAVGYTAYWDMFEYGPTIDANVCKTYGSTNVVIRNNYITNVGGDGITTMYCYQPLIEYNVLDGYCQDMTLDIYGNNNQRVAAGIWPWMCKTPIFQYNEAYNSTYCPDAQAWDADWGDNAIYQYNYSCNNAGGAVMFCGTYACNSVFRYNISQNDLSGVLNLAGSPNGEIYNNVFYIAEGVKINRDGMSGGRGNTISNNIFYYTGSEPASAVYGNWGDIQAEWRNNIYYNYETTPDDKYAITADPLFVDPGKGPTGAQASGLVHDRSVFKGYMLQDASPAIDAGVPIENRDIYLNSGVDFFGNKLDLLPDVGVYEAGTCNVEGAQTAVKVNVAPNDTATVIDTTGHYTESDLVGLNTAVATVKLTTDTQLTHRAGAAVTALETGKYVILSTRANKPMTNASASADGGNGLSLNGTRDSMADGSIWTVTVVNGGCTVQDADGKYLTVGSNTAGLTDAESVVKIAPNGSNWTISQNDAYLNDFGGKRTCAAGWQHASAPNDAGSQWILYKAEEVTVKSTTLTVTGVAHGTTDVLLGTTLYRISVAGEPAQVVPSEDLSIQSTVYMLTDNTIHVPSIEGNPSTAGEVLDNVFFAEGVSAVIVKNGEAVQDDETVTDGMALRAVATNGGYTDYPIAVDNVYHFAEDYSFDHQGNVWFYQYIGTDGNYANLGIVGGWEDWMYDWTNPGSQNGSSNTYLTVCRQNGSDDGVLCGTIFSGRNVNVAAMAWRAPKSGSVTLSFGGSAAAGGAKLRAANGDNGGTVELWITHNGVRIGEPIRVTGTLTTIDDIEIQVQKGDYIRLEAHNFTDSSLANPSFHVTPVISYNAACVDHSWSDWEVIKEATYMQEGEKTRKCGACGETETEVIAVKDLPFVDVEDESFYEMPVRWALDNEITKGTTETTFGPNDICQRGQVVTFLWRAAGSPEPANTENPFKDVEEGAFYYKAVLWAVEQGITNGVDTTHFAPNKNCNRAQIVTFLWRAQSNPETDSAENPFKDVEDGAFYYKAILWAVENGITNGVDETHFAPNTECNRAQVVTFLYRTHND